MLKLSGINSEKDRCTEISYIKWKGNMVED